MQMILNKDVEQLKADTSLENIIVSIHTLKHQVRLLIENNNNFDFSRHNVLDEDGKIEEESKHDISDGPKELRMAPYRQGDSDEDENHSK